MSNQLRSRCARCVNCVWKTLHSNASLPDFRPSAGLMSVGAYDAVISHTHRYVSSPESVDVLGRRSASFHLDVNLAALAATTRHGSQRRFPRHARRCHREARRDTHHHPPLALALSAWLTIATPAPSTGIPQPRSCAPDRVAHTIWRRRGGRRFGRLPAREQSEHSVRSVGGSCSARGCL